MSVCAYIDLNPAAAGIVSERPVFTVLWTQADSELLSPTHNLSR